MKRTIKRIALLIALALMMPSLASAQNPKSQEWQKVGPKLEGEVTESDYGRAKKLAKSVTAVMQDGKWGFIKEDGKFKIKPRYDAIGKPASAYTSEHGHRLTQTYIPVMQDGKWGIVSFEGKEILKPANGKPIISDEMLYGAQWLCFGDDKAFYTLNTSGEFTRRNKQNFFKEYGILTTQGIMDLKSRPTHCSMAISIAERLTKIFHSTLITPAQAP